ncbi:MAG TPA: rRNA maturation RNase YbeY [Chthoniobacterales bacterium]|nr:rRNA maturation RNase YbeY [Chthoniobacterales bacterium]
MTISVQNRQRRWRVPTTSLQEFAERALGLVLRERLRGKSELAGLTNVDVLLVSDRRIAELHEQFMNIPGPTDVITFQHGEIFVSVDTARENSRRFRTSLEDELRLYVAHGLLHLHGFDDQRPTAARTMAAAQKRIVAEAKERD